MTSSLSDLDHLLSAVLASPEDDTVRGAYADALDEAAGGYSARGEFIRVQVEKHWLESKEGGEHADHPDAERNCVLCAKVSALGRRERELLRIVWGREGEVKPLSNFVCEGIALDRATMPRVEFRRGFVEVVTAPLATLIGGVCSCGVTQAASERYSIPRHARHCPACSGTGRTPGILRDVLKCQPVTCVVVTDRRVVPRNLSGGYRTTTWGQSELPLDLLELVRQQELHFAEIPGGVGSDLPYETNELADAALSAALLKWGKS